MNQIRAYKPVIWRIFTTSASIASLLGLFLSLNGDTPWHWWMWVLACIAASAFLVFIIFEFRGHGSVKVYSKTERQKIRNYMSQWIEHGGRVAIWTRDHSWINDDGMKRLLRRKAESHELIMCLPDQTPFTKELAGLGAEIVAYGKAAGLPTVRFTIANYERDGSAVAIGRPSGQFHVISEYGSKSESGNDVALLLAQDAIRLARQFGNLKS